MNNRHAQCVLEKKASSSVQARNACLRLMGWDVTPPTMKYSLMFRELSGKPGLHESLECFSGYCLKDMGLYADWSFERSDNVTDQDLATGFFF